MKKTRKKTRQRRGPRWELRLYVANHSPRSLLARENVARLCARYAPQVCRVTIVDLAKQPVLARRDEIVAVPTLVRINPGPQKAVVGTLADTEQVLRALAMSPKPEATESLLLASGIRVGQA